MVSGVAWFFEEPACEALPMHAGLNLIGSEYFWESNAIDTAVPNIMGPDAWGPFPQKSIGSLRAWKMGLRTLWSLEDPGFGPGFQGFCSKQIQELNVAYGLFSKIMGPVWLYNISYYGT